MRVVSLLFCMILLLTCSLVFAQSSCGVRLSEFLPNPVGDDVTGEFIELENTCDEIISLEGMKISDRYGAVKSFTFSGIQIKPNGFFVLQREDTAISLNNDVEQIELVDAQGELIDRSDVYEGVKEGYALARFAQSWKVVLPTLETINIDSTSTPSPASSPIPSNNPSPIAVINSQARVRLHEINPCNKTLEWIELYNSESYEVRLEGWWIQDSTSQRKYLDDVVVPANGYAVYEWSGYFLNNDGDSVRLYVDSSEVDSMTYDGCTDTTTWQRFNEHDWIQQTHSSKGFQNIKIKEDVSMQDDKKASISALPSGVTKNLNQQKAYQPYQHELHWLDPRDEQGESRIITSQHEEEYEPYPSLILLFISTFFFEAFGGLSVAWYNLKE